MGLRERPSGDLRADTLLFPDGADKRRRDGKGPGRQRGDSCPLSHLEALWKNKALQSLLRFKPS